MYLFIHHREHVLLPHEKDIAASLVFFEFVAGPSREYDRFTFLDLQRATTSILDHFARADREYFAFLRLVLSVIGKNDPARSFLVRLESANNDSIPQRLHLH